MTSHSRSRLRRIEAARSAGLRRDRQPGVLGRRRRSGAPPGRHAYSGTAATITANAFHHRNGTASPAAIGTIHARSVRRGPDDEHGRHDEPQRERDGRRLARDVRPSRRPASSTPR